MERGLLPRAACGSRCPPWRTSRPGPLGRRRSPLSNLRNRVFKPEPMAAEYLAAEHLRSLDESADGLRVAFLTRCTPVPGSPMMRASRVLRCDPRIAVCAIVRGQAPPRSIRHPLSAARFPLVLFLRLAVQLLRRVLKRVCAVPSDVRSSMPSSAARDGTPPGQARGRWLWSASRSCAWLRRTCRRKKRTIGRCWRLIGGAGEAVEGSWTQRVVAQPPESGMIWPGMKLASVARKSASAAVSSGRPRRCAGTTPRMRFRNVSSSVSPGG